MFADICGSEGHCYDIPGFMVVGMIIMLIFGTVVAVFRNTKPAPCCCLKSPVSFTDHLFVYLSFQLLGLLISFLMIHQVKRHDSIGGPSITMKGY
ncbi:hypothetical protein GOODEAATRI_030164 [Goodea atripinnis]|uniref:Uncharacterized protein n=1 Tax=Goodea atripinnis TaxID=208336 RepID=A0ABV0NPF6_9TELE